MVQRRFDDTFGKRRHRFERSPEFDKKSSKVSTKFREVFGNLQNACKIWSEKNNVIRRSYEEFEYKNLDIYHSLFKNKKQLKKKRKENQEIEEEIVYQKLDKKHGRKENKKRKKSREWRENKIEKEKKNKKRPKRSEKKHLHKYNKHNQRKNKNKKVYQQISQTASPDKKNRNRSSQKQNKY